jgi:hypothetical protein
MHADIPRPILALATFVVVALTNLPHLQGQQPLAVATPTVLSADAMAKHHATLSKKIDAAPTLQLIDGGLCGVHCSATVRLSGTAEAVIQLPLPQLLGGQVPIDFTFATEPPNALRQLAIVHDERGGSALQATVQGKGGDDVRFAWSAVVLMAERPEPATAAMQKEFVAATACAEADHADVVAFAKEIAPADATPATVAVALRVWIARQSPKQPLQHFGALSLLQNGNHGICTINANLAAAVLRRRGVPTCSLAVVPTNGMRLEMHRIVAWIADDRWHRFDPSGVHATVPMRTCDSVVVACTSIADEQRAAKPRMSAPIGCPWGQEMEIVRGPAFAFGVEFFTTQAKPLAAFAVDDATLTAARTAWQRFLTNGTLDAAAERAAAARDLATFAAAWRP